MAFVDSIPLAVCHNRRISRQRVFKDLAARDKIYMGWFYGFKMHLIVNNTGELLAACMTPGNVDDRKPVEAISADVSGKLFGDKGYTSQGLFERGLEAITSLRRNMRGQLMLLSDRLLLPKSFLIETITD